MKTLALYLNGKQTHEGWSEWWSDHDATGNDFIECIDKRVFGVPAPWTKVYINGENGNVLHYDVEFGNDSGDEGYLSTNSSGQPVVVDWRTGRHTPLIEIDE